MDNLFQSFNANISVSNFAELSGSVFNWLEEYCKPQVKPSTCWENLLSTNCILYGIFHPIKTGHKNLWEMKICFYSFHKNSAQLCIDVWTINSKLLIEIIIISMISDYVFHSAFFLFIPDTARCHSWNSSTNQQHVNNIYTCITLIIKRKICFG